MAIGVEGQFFVSFEVGKIKDFILREEDLIEFTIIEEGGNVLPTFRLIFRTNSDKLLAVLNETNELKARYGVDSGSARDASLNSTKIIISPDGHGRRVVTTIGTMSALKYITSTKLMLTQRKTGVEVIRDVASKHFGARNLDFNIEKSDEVSVVESFNDDGSLKSTPNSPGQVWIQDNTTDKRFVSQVWMHSFMSKGFLSCAITSDGKFILRDMVKYIRERKGKPVWTFTTNPVEKNSIVYDPDVVIESNTGFINYWLGYGQTPLVYDLEDDVSAFTSEDIQPKLGLTDNISRQDGINRRFHSAKMQSANVHTNYWGAYIKNLTENAVMSSVKVTLSFDKFFKDVKVLDLVSLKDPSVGEQGTTSEAQSGLYIVSRVARTFQKKSVITNVEMVRDSMSNQSGIVAASNLTEEEQLKVAEEQAGEGSSAELEV